jgi:hypothetical protein
MKEGRYVELKLIDRMMSEILNRTEGAMKQIGESAYARVMSSATPNLFGLNQMIKERLQYYSERLDDYKYLIKRFDNPSIFIGRRGQDIVRELSLETLEEGFLRGNPTAFTEKKLIDRLVNSPKVMKFADRESAETAMKQFHSTVVDKIPLFHEDGEAKFMLQVRSGGEDGEYRGKFQAWSAEKYADLVAITTAAEADVAANLDQAREIGTRIVKWNSTGKGADFYLRIGDTRCARVDGQYASIEPGGTTINGVYYPYYKSEERLPGRFSICHPNCRHRLTPVPEEILGDDLRQSEKSKVANPPKIIAAQDEAQGYGVRIADFGSDKNLPIANQLNQVLKGLVSEGKPVPERVVIDHKEFEKLFKDEAGDTPAMFIRPHPGNQYNSIYINPRAGLWRDTERKMKQLFNSGYSSSSDPLHVVNHEIGHFLHYNALGNQSYQFFRDTPLTSLQINMIRTEVSAYATSNPIEFVAETYAGLKAGRKYSDEIMRLYAYFGGVQ